MNYRSYQESLLGGGHSGEISDEEVLGTGMR